MGLDVFAREIEDELMTALAALASREVQHPIRMRAVEIAVRIDHLRLHPQAEAHPEPVHLVDERLQSVWELVTIDYPVTKPGTVAVARAEPAVVHDEALHAERGRLLGKAHLPGFVDLEFRGFPGVVKDRAQGGGRTFR